MITEELYWDKVNNIARDLDLLLLGFKGNEKGNSKCKLFCKEHSYYWESTNISNLLFKKKSTCKFCCKLVRKSSPLSKVEDTYYERINTLCRNLDVLFLGFLPRKKDITKTKCKMFCKKHKLYWETTCIGNFLNRKTNPCKSCSSNRRATKTREPEEKLLMRVKEACFKYNTEFLTWTGSYNGILSLITHRCKIHNIITTNTNARSLVENKNKTSGCRECHKKQYKSSILVNTANHIQQFKKLNTFVDGTVFSRNMEKVTTAGVYNYWDVYCPTCKETNTTFVGSLKKGCLPCYCSKFINNMGFYPDWYDRDDNLYLLEYDTSEGLWYKIGRSFDVSKRLTNLRCTYKEISVISTITSDHKTVYDTEVFLQRLLQEHKYNPKIWFGGSGECFTSEILKHPEIISTFNLDNLGISM